MIEEMKFLSIIGPKNDIDRVIETYVSKFEFQPENALTELKNVYGLHNFEEDNPYKASLEVSEQIRIRLFEEYADAALQKNAIPSPLETDPYDTTDYEQAAELVARIQKDLIDLDEKREIQKKQRDDILDKLHMIEQYTNLDYNLSNILHFKFIKFRFGRIEKRNYQKLANFNELQSIFYAGKEDDTYIWGVYFVPDKLAEKVDAIYSSLHFERFFLPDIYEGTPAQAKEAFQQKLEEQDLQIKAVDEQIHTLLDSQKENIILTNALLRKLDSNYNIRKLAAVTRKEKDEFYILCGWMTKDDTNKLQEEIANDQKTFLIIEKNHDNIHASVPTKLKNPALFRPFELFVEMYGLPKYGEIDPTPLIAISYSILFGFMFGDVGQGALLFLSGLILYKVKHIKLAGIIASCGFFSILFGFCFGSIFGFEDLIAPIWLHPTNALTFVPGIGSLNTVFVVAIALGMGMTLLTMILNIISRFRFHEKGAALFGQNGVTGLVFYLNLVICIILIFTQQTILAGAFIFLLFLLPLLIILLEEPLNHLLNHQRFLPDHIGMFLTQGFFELVEILLSYFSNTLSFVRVGAFAISHGAMMQVVLMLSGYESGNTNWMIIILGNLFVCGMEGLIVGIQVLRLEYYELFSRFYTGGGKPFKPLRHEAQK